VSLSRLFFSFEMLTVSQKVRKAIFLRECLVCGV
jgi:hypothetical protein